MIHGANTIKLSIAAWLALAVAGCAVVTPQTQIATSRARFESALISYRVDSGGAGSHDPPAESQPAFKAVASKQRTVLLQIQYPHPAGRSGFARLEMIVGSPAAGPDNSLAGQLRRALSESAPGIAYAPGVTEAWAMDLSAGELDRLLAQLETAGYFAPGDPGEPGVILTAKIDGCDFQRAWHRAAELEELCARARKQGKLVSHVQPLEPPPVLAATASPGAEPPPVSTPWRSAAVVPAQALEPAYEITRLPPVDPAGDNSGTRDGRNEK